MLDSADTIARALDDKTRKPARKAKKAGKPKKVKTHRPRKESTKTITTRLYKMWSEVVKHAYANCCAMCGAENTPDKPLNAHHIMPRQNFSGLRFDPRNGIALCPKCHKLGKFSAHKSGIWFAHWVLEHLPETYRFCINNAYLELDCKDRAKLYKAEDFLMTYGLFGKHDNFNVTALKKDGGDVHAVVSAHNAKAAEFLFWNSWPTTETQLKGIVKCEKEKADK